MKIKFTIKIWIWLIFLALSLIAIFWTPYFLQKGVEIKSVEQNSSAFEQGLRQGQVITAIDGKAVTNIKDYSKIIQEKFVSDAKIKTTVTTNKGEFVVYSNTSLEITVSELAKTNINTGLDLSGGSRALVKAEKHELTSSEVNDLVSVVSNRFNVYGISDIVVRPVRDLSGNYFMLIEIAGATPKDLENLISQQGKFEAKIGNETVFIGGEKDITNVAQGGDKAMVSCPSGQGGGTYVCNFQFLITLSQAAAERHAAVTSNLSINSTSQGNYLSKTLDLYLDDKFLSSLLISEDLKGIIPTQNTVSIQGSGQGPTLKDASDSAQEEMDKLQTILMTGSLPFKLEIVKLDTISPALGGNFTRYILFAGIIALLSVVVVVFVKYRKLKLVFPPLLIATSEIIITLGIASVFGQDLDLPGIAGILAAIGTGIDDQIVVLDEAKQKEELNIKQRIKRAFAIVLGAYFTVAVSLLPLLWAGAGLLKGFAIMSLIGITIGVLITRPAFADMVRRIEE